MKPKKDNSQNDSYTGTVDNKGIIVPNSELMAGNIIYYTTNLTRRVDLQSEQSPARISTKHTPCCWRCPHRIRES